MVNEKLPADTFFPKLKRDEWEKVKVVNESEVVDRRHYSFKFVTMKRKERK